MHLLALLKTQSIRLASAIALVGIGATSAGCVITTTDTTPSGSGTLYADWTIYNRKVTTDCSATNIATVRVDVLDVNGNKVNTGSDTQDCTAFATSFTYSFPYGTYTVNITPLDPSGNPRTNVYTQSVYLSASQPSVTVPVDWEANSFF